MFFVSVKVDWLFLLVIWINMVCVLLFRGSFLFLMFLVCVSSCVNVFCDSEWNVIICEWDNNVVFSLKDGFLVVVFIRVMVLFFMMGRKLFCWVWLNWWILLMNKSVVCLFMCCICVVLNIFFSLLIFEKIVEICLKVRLVLFVSKWVIVVLFVFGGF